MTPEQATEAMTLISRMATDIHALMLFASLALGWTVGGLLYRWFDAPR